MDDSVGTKNVNGDDAAVKIDSQASETNVGAQALRLATNTFTSKQSGNCMCDKDPTSWVEVPRDMIGEDLFQDFLRRFGSMLGDLFKSIIGWSENGEVGRCAIEELDKIFIFINQGGQLGSVL